MSRHVATCSGVGLTYAGDDGIPCSGDDVTSGRIYSQWEVFESKHTVKGEADVVLGVPFNGVRAGDVDTVLDLTVWRTVTPWSV